MSSEYAVFFGVDVGKGEHDACALDRRAGGCTTSRCPTTRPDCGFCSNGSPSMARC